jgi:oligopeptide/dipeptide ABC transporter ATP-binding protein
MSLLEIKNLTVEFTSDGISFRAVDGLSLSLDAGETVGLVGESGSGKSVAALSIARLLPSPPARQVSGEILLEGTDVFKMSQAQLRRIRGGVVGYIFQDPGASLNPIMSVGRQIKESMRLHRPEASTDADAVALLRRVGIPDPETRLRYFAHQLSGGMRQRVMVAMALASHPQLLVADEPTTALDVTIQAQILELLSDIKQEMNMGILLITHNLGIVSEHADRVAVMYAGQIVESAPADELLGKPLHPYTQALLRAVPQIGSQAQSLRAIPGQVPSPGDKPGGCRFHPRCPLARPDCRGQSPPLAEVSANRSTRCLFWKELA